MSDEEKWVKAYEKLKKEGMLALFVLHIPFCTVAEI